MKFRHLLVLLALSLAGPESARAACEATSGNADIANPGNADCRTVFTYTEDTDSGDNIALGYPVPFPVDSASEVDGFRSYDFLHARHQDLMMSSPDVTGEIVGQTREGRDIWAYVIGDPDATTVEGRPEGAVMINATIHPREWAAPEVATDLFEELVARGGDDGLGSYLRDNLNVVLIPVHNVDGFLQTQRFPDKVTALRQQPREGRMRRKNMRHPDGTTVDTSIGNSDDFFGVDLNRNSSKGFGNPNASSSSNTSLIHHGPSAASEVETRTLQDAAALAPGSRLRFYEDIHSFSQIFLAPRTGDTRRDRITDALAASMGAVADYDYGPSGPGGEIGSTDSWFAFQFQVPAWTLEIEPNGQQSGTQYGGSSHGHNGFVLPDAEVDRVRSGLTDTHLIGFYRMTGPPAIKAVQIRDADSDELVFDAEWVVSGGGRALDIRTSEALVSGSDYRLWIAFDKPMRHRDADGAVTRFPGQRIGLTPRVTVELDDDSGQRRSLTVAGDQDGWQDQAGGAPDGYLRYRDDAWTGTLSLPEDVEGPTPAVLTVASLDMSGQKLDTDPATIVGWSAGHWTGYEDTAGDDDTDEGGVDCRVKFFVADDPDASAPSGSITCNAEAAAGDDDDDDDSSGGGGGTGGGGGGGSSGGSGGGGGSAQALLFLLGGAILLGWRRRQETIPRRA